MKLEVIIKLSNVLMSFVSLFDCDKVTAFFSLPQTLEKISFLAFCQFVAFGALVVMIFPPEIAVLMTEC